MMPSLSKRTRELFGPLAAPFRRWADRVGPTPPILHRRVRRRAMPPVSFVCVYRQRNASFVRSLIDELPPDVHVALWALDEIAPSLADETVGNGPGLRVDNLNRLAEIVASTPGYLVMADDDITFPRSTLTDLVKAADSCQLDVSGPSHLLRTNTPVRFMRRRTLTLVRLTRFVESGPVLVLSPRARAALLPLPDETGMGWGLEGHWGDPTLNLRLGIVDGVRLVHHGAVAVDYDKTDAQARNNDALARAGLHAWKEWQTVDAVWRPWQRRPKWVR